MCQADNDLERQTAHDFTNVHDVADLRIAAVELDQDVGGVCGQNTECNNGDDSWYQTYGLHLRFMCEYITLIGYYRDSVPFVEGKGSLFLLDL